MGPMSYMWSAADQNIRMRSVTVEWEQSNRGTTIIQNINAEVKRIRQRRWKYTTKWQNFWNHCIQPEGDYYQADKYEYQKHTDSYLPSKMYDYFIWCVSCTVIVLTCFVICGVRMCGFCNVWVCVCVGFVMCGCVYVWVL